ncbi:MAG: hypothetical protein NC548_10855 [Lachnospiraceae bacterium]|nr:hypothetical protein [Lachnospiraceae bacterium]
MRKFIKIFLLGLASSLLLAVPVFASKLPSGNEPAPVVDEAGFGGGGGGGEGEGPAPPPAEPKEPDILSYTPVVTALHSLNAILANDGTAVYFMPQLQDFPVDLVDTCADITTEDGQEHKFAVVYDGYFDTEVAYNLAQNANTDTSDVVRYQTSKKVYSQSDNSRALNLLGYDLLLSNEESSIVTQNEWITVNYLPTLVGTSPMTTKTIVMDLYKAMGVYEWDIKVAFGEDESLEVNTSPIMQQIAVLTNDEVEGGIDTREGATYVWASRTNPDQYWTRCKRDAIFDGGAHKYTKKVYVGNKVSVSFSKNETQTMTMKEFCQVARAIMELYGEPILTEQEIEIMIQTYALTLPAGNMTADEIEAIRYLAAKGIIDPADMQWEKNVTFADIEEILLRIADEDSRLTFKYNVNPDSTMVRAGYAKVPIASSDIPFDNIEEIVNPFDSDYYDYFIEAVDGYTNFYLNKLAGIDLSEQENLIADNSDAMPSPSASPGVSPGPSPSIRPNNNPPVGTISVNPIIQEGKEYAFACDKLVVAGADNIATTPGSGYFEYKGLREIDGRFYYHMQISRDLGSVTIQYDYDPELEQLLDITEYSLPDSDGGVYNFSPDLPAKLTLDEAGFTDEFVDADREQNDYLELKQTEAYLSEYNWMRIQYNTTKWEALVRGQIGGGKAAQYDYNGKTIVISAQDLEMARGTADRRFEDPAGNVWWVYESTNGSYTDVINVICQTKMSYAKFQDAVVNGYSKIDSNSAYYRAEDGTLLASYEYLKNVGLCSGIQQLRNGSGLMLSTTVGNVSLRSDLDIIIVGDTIIPVQGELMYYEEAGQYYINLKACLGWSNDYVVINNDMALIPIMKSTSSRPNKAVTTSKSLRTFFPKASVGCAYQRLTSVSSINQNGEGFALTGTNALGCYMCVYDINGDTDYLFVWHRNDVKAPDGNIYTVDEGDARSRFRQLTGVDLSSVSSKYSLLCYQLNRNNVGNPVGIQFLSYDYISAYSEGTANMGYVYNPPVFQSMDDALNAFVSGSESCPLPIAYIGSTNAVNLNLNTCTDMEGNEQLPIGTLPMQLESTKKDDANKMGKINRSGSNVEATSATYDNLDNVKLLAAPVGIFQTIKGLGTRSVSEWSKYSGSVYFGSSQCNLKGTQLAIKNKVLEFDNNVDAVCSLMYSAGKSIYVINEDSTSLGDALADKLEDIGVVVTDPESLIDWSAYKFHRLVEDMDSWTSILLIFVLNVLPRVAMLLFFVLMLFALIKDVKFWRSFCVNHFDVYSFLTMGKQNVDTIDMKRVVIISLICFSIFLIIMDGQLFNFIIFICRFFVEITQR